MSKHFPGRYPKQDRDFYPTPMPTVRPLIPHLKAARIREFCEPCAGEGHLVRHIESFGLRCVYAGDILDGGDALAIEHFPAPVITNTPFSRSNFKLMLALIEHFMRAAPCAWLLLPHDRINTSYMRRFLPQISDVVVAGRDQWLENGKRGTTDLAWFRLDRRHTSGPIVHNGSALIGSAPTRRCPACGAAFRPARTDAIFCASACRQRAYRQRISVTEA